MRRVSLLLLLSLLFTSFSPRSQAASLEEALNKTLNDNLAIKVGSYKNLVNKRDIVNSAVKGILPKIEYDFLIAKSGAGYAPGNNVSTITLTQPMFDGATTLYLDKARYLHVIEDIVFALEKQKVLLSVIKKYMGVITAREVNKLNENNVNILKKHLLAAEKRFSVGEITKTELLLAKTRFSSAKSDAINSRSRLRSAEASYTHLVGEAPVDLQYPAHRPQIPQSPEEAMEIAKESNLSLMLHKHHHQTSRRDTAMAVARKFLPSLVLSASESFSGTDIRHTTHSLRVRLHFPIFEHGVGLMNIDRAYKARQQSFYSLQEAAKEVEESIVLAWENLTTSRSTIQSARDSIKYTEVALEATQQEAQLNLKTTLDVLDVEQELLKAKVHLIEAQSNLVITQYNLLALIGQLNIN